MMHGVASNNTAQTTTATTNMLAQAVDGSGAAAVVASSVAQAAQTAYKPDTINFSIKLTKDSQSSMLFSEQHQRKLEMLESRFVPLNPQKVTFFYD